MSIKKANRVLDTKLCTRFPTKVVYLVCEKSTYHIPPIYQVINQKTYSY